ncbi:hypothetical protein AB0P15_04115 [Streptomyces sp. NPDC087917]|uniref:hypothetical protein n=1 Tax=unclassified Streptomyces TaxID=2593676 RepID=UPI00343ABA44
MGGRKHRGIGSRGRPGRRAALLLLVAFGVAAGVAFLCVRPVESHPPVQPVRAYEALVAPSGDDTAAPGSAAHDTASHATTAHGTAAHDAAGPGTRVSCVDPDGLPGCSPTSRVTPAVLPGPPPADRAPARGSPAPEFRPAGPRPLLPPAGHARAPDLHALQVLRT